MKIGVCCSSSDNIDKVYLESSEKLLEQVFQEKNDLVFGAMNQGIMGIAYRLAKKYNRKVTGIAPEIYQDDFKNLDCDTEIVTHDVSERTKALVDHSDMLLFLPGGVGTLYELMSAIEMKRSGEFDKPIILYNETGCFTEMIFTLYKTYQRNFTSEKVKSNYQVVSDARSILSLLNREQREEEDLER